MALIWRPAVATGFVGFSAAPKTTHVNATVANPSFSIVGPIRGVRFHMPDNGGVSEPNDGRINVSSFTTTQTGVVTSNAGWAPVVPVFPAGGQPGPFTKTQAGILITLNSDGNPMQTDAATGFHLGVQDSDNTGPSNVDTQWLSLEFGQPVTNFAITTNGFQITPLPSEGVSQLQVLVDTEDAFGECGCCPAVGIPPRCYNTEEVQAPFNTVVITSNPQGYTLAGGPINRLIDHLVTGPIFTGFNTPAGQISDANSPVLEFTFATPQDQVTRVLEYNQGGGDLNDQDGFASYRLQVFSSTNILLFSGTMTCGNGAAPFGLIFPAPLDDVKRMTWDRMKKLINGTVSPLSREFRAFKLAPSAQAVALLCGNVLTWFDAETGDEVDPINFLEDGPAQVIFNVAGTTTNDGWIETGTPSAAPQPPNRVLPAPIFNNGPGVTYSPQNGAVGRWEIAKTVNSALAGPGKLRVPAGFQINADDLISAIRVNGVLAPFTYGAVIAPSTAVVTWLAGANVVEIEFSNTIAGNTAAAGRLEAILPRLIDC